MGSPETQAEIIRKADRQRACKPEDLDSTESRQWEELCDELERAARSGDSLAARRAAAKLDRLRYGSL